LKAKVTGMTAVKDKLRPRTQADLYDRDLFAWTAHQSEALAERRAADIDWKNLAEEVRSSGHAEKNEIESRLLVLLVHLLKWSFQLNKRKHGWAATIREQRRRISKRIETSPSLAGYPAEVVAEEYADARLTAADETRLALASFPTVCPFTIAEILDPDFWPDKSPR
jgi:hypothetical protein